MMTIRTLIIYNKIKKFKMIKSIITHLNLKSGIGGNLIVLGKEIKKI
jgi:hypothetical protein